MDFYKAFNPKVSPGLGLEATLINEDNASVVADSIAETFCTKEPNYVILEVPKIVLFEKKCLPLCKKAIKEKLGVVCVNQQTKEYVGSCVFVDMNNRDTEPYYTEKDEKLEKIEIMLKHAKEFETLHPHAKPQKNYEVIVLQSVSVNPRYSRLGIGEELIKVCIEEHPLIRNAKMILSEAINESSLKVHLKAGFNVFWQKAYEQIEKEESPKLEYLKEITKHNEKAGFEAIKNLYVMGYFKNPPLLQPSL